MNVYTYRKNSDKAPKQIVVLLHGLGSNGQDLISLAPYFAEELPDAVFVSPDAPFPCDMAPVGFQWFSLRDWSKESKLKGVEEAFPILQKFLEDQLKEYNLTPDNMALVGFSQGTMMSLYTAPKFTDKIAGVLGYSGALVLGDNDNHENFKKPPVQLVHGDSDSVVPVSACHEAEDILKSAGFKVSKHISQGLQHSIDEAGIQIGIKFLKQHLAA